MFYGDWYEVLGISDAGYFLGAELINKFDDKYSIEDVARLEFNVIEKEVLRFLRDN
ncbi:hypothetical protein GOQ29_09750 [Clostridium sp. D2Q-14]|uniref:hypothetical protein n=1 Tax=Anaeromonas gelatinilytica TaxID=2683194 RepID=UPI00193BBBA1|nr:hypothetical protein [Anaeromonas gelatinilytica]MBS4535896.1 hypothetical protein [Anaeromonas gelatinilytica]